MNLLAFKLINSSHLSPAAGSSEGPASKAVSNIGGVAGSAAETVVEVVVVDRAAVVHAGSSKVVSLGTSSSGASSLGHGLLETVSAGGTGGTVLDHLVDLVPGARVDAGT